MLLFLPSPAAALPSAWKRPLSISTQCILSALAFASLSLLLNNLLAASAHSIPTSTHTSVRPANGDAAPDAIAPGFPPEENPAATDAGTTLYDTYSKKDASPESSASPGSAASEVSGAALLAFLDEHRHAFATAEGADLPKPSEAEPPRFFERDAELEGAEGPRRPLELFDYIVVGAGAAGCPFARTMANAGSLSQQFTFSGYPGKRVLVIDRGPARSAERTPWAMDLEGAGRGINDESISQPVVTTQGVRTHIGKVMGGGTSVNVAIMVQELDEYFTYLNREHGHSWDIEAVHRASAWVEQKVAWPMLQDNDFSRAVCRSFVEQKFIPHGGFHEDGNYTYPIPTSVQLRHGEFWRSMSLFNSSDAGFRNAADIFLAANYGANFASFTPAENIELITDHIVLKVVFDMSGLRPRARCVNYRRTRAFDLRTLGESSPRRQRRGASARLWRAMHSEFSIAQNLRPPRVFHACVREGGEVVMASGAILSAVNLFKSGVGPAKQIAALGLPLILDVPELGQKFSDRIAVPVGLFLTREQQRKFSAPRISDVIGFRAFGPECSDFAIGARTLKCTQVIVETMYGPHAMDGPILAARALVPPHLRNTTVMSATFRLFSRCAQATKRERRTMPICILLRRAIECASRTAVQFTFISEPKSRGSVRLERNGNVRIDAKYLQDPQDFFDAIRGLQTTLERVNSDAFRGLVDPLGETACPVFLLDTFLQIVTKLLQETSPASLTPELLEEVQRHHDTMVRIFPVTDADEGDDEDEDEKGISANEHRKKTGATPATRGESRLSSLERIADMQRLLENLLERASDENDNERVLSRPAYTVHLPRLARSMADPGCNATCKLVSDEFTNGLYSKTCPLQDVYYRFYGLCPSSAEAKRDRGAEASEREEPDDEDLVIRIPASSRSFQQKETLQASQQWVASYPPILPSPDDPQQMAEYVLTFMSSIWHHAGTAAMGTVVDDFFRVKGLDGLSVVDASVLPQITRGNPTATLLMMGRYAALKKLGALAQSHAAVA
ncbi:GMC oxidoreductase [Besnoitia besnoiti]|uniref:GMC oxidoreductase n=1 Tax=Besnoitia besnoiti TaxID=94643 RepID=A0A2A9MB73_BESBE|nr:GMC oxidoreductase [Besnoitia besnoiti]PFH32923.1 GMC oxidoreductase [Besnoitia besnoiti]